MDTSSRCAFGPYSIEILDFFPRRCAQAQPSLQPVIAQDPRLPLLEGPISAASLARLGDDDPMLLTELLCGACAFAGCITCLREDLFGRQLRKGICGFRGRSHNFRAT